MTGFIKCAHFNEVDLPSPLYLFKSKLISWSRGYVDVLFSNIIQKASKKSDVICLQYADLHRHSPLAMAVHTIGLPKEAYFANNEVLWLSNSVHVDLFKLNNVWMDNNYIENATISHFYRVIYYVAPTKRKNQENKPLMLCVVKI